MEKIQLFYWSSVQLEHLPRENYGDLLSRYIVEKISRKQVVWKDPRARRWYLPATPIYLAAGSIIRYADKKCVVWGSGIISRTDPIQEAVFLAVRGPETLRRIEELGYSCPRVFGDPAVLLPRLYSPDVEKRYEFGIVPHYVDYAKIASWYKDDPDVHVIDLLNDDVEDVTRQILSCKRIMSSSLHGIIVSHAFNLPCVWVKFSDKLYGDDVKFHDYFGSVALDRYVPEFIGERPDAPFIDGLFGRFAVLPEAGAVAHLQEGLLKACPFLDEAERRAGLSGR